MPNELETMKRAALFGSYASRAFSNLALRLLQQSIGTPGFAEAYEEIAAGVLADLPLTSGTGFGGETEATVRDEAIGLLRIQFDGWLKQVQEGEALVLGWPPVEEVTLDPSDSIVT